MDVYVNCPLEITDPATGDEKACNAQFTVRLTEHHYGADTDGRRGIRRMGAVVIQAECAHAEECLPLSFGETVEEWIRKKALDTALAY